VYSEDPRLTAALTNGYVTGIQGAHPNGTQKTDYMQAGACCKHYVVGAMQGAALPACMQLRLSRFRSARPTQHPHCACMQAYDLEGNGGLPSRVYFDAQVDTRSFWEHYMPAFHDCIVTSKAMHAMCSYNSMNGLPTCMYSSPLMLLRTCTGAGEDNGIDHDKN
jgi:beta-glucosidase-like glycosyl hydrolase